MKPIRVFVVLVTLFPLFSQATSCPKTIYTFNTSFKEGLIEAKYSGKHRKIEGEKRKFIDLAKTAFPDIEYVLDLYKYEVLLKSDSGEELWLPIQDQVFEKIRVDASSNESLKFFCRSLGAVNEKIIVLIIDYEKLQNSQLH